MAIYTKHGSKIMNESICIDNDCCMGRTVVKIHAVAEGETSPQYFWVSDLTADHGKQEIQDVIKANRKERELNK